MRQTKSNHLGNPLLLIIVYKCLFTVNGGYDIDMINLH